MVENANIRDVLFSVTGLLIGAALLLTGNGLLFTLVPLRAGIELFSTQMVSLMGAAYFSGFALGCILVPSLIGRVGHIRVFSALTALVSAAVLLQGIWVSNGAWLSARLVAGISLAGLYIVMESWLGDASPAAQRGQVFSVYAVISFLAVIAGQALLPLAGIEELSLFAIVAILLSLAIIPVSLTASRVPVPIENVRPKLRWTLETAPAAAYGCFFVGAANGAFWSLAANLAGRAELGVNEISLFISISVAGGALLQWPLGYLSDHVDRRIVIVAAALAASIAGMLLALAGVESVWRLYALGAAFGGSAFSLYAICVAHGNERVAQNEIIMLGSSLLLLFSAGAALGPVAATVLLQVGSIGALFLFTAGAHAILGLLVAGTIRTKKPVPEEEREQFVAVPDTVPTAYDMHPAAHEEEAELEFRPEDELAAWANRENDSGTPPA